MTSTLTLSGRRGTYGTGLALVTRLVLGVNLLTTAPEIFRWIASSVACALHSELSVGH